MMHYTNRSVTLKQQPFSLTLPIRENGSGLGVSELFVFFISGAEDRFLYWPSLSLVSLRGGSDAISWRPLFKFDSITGCFSSIILRKEARSSANLEREWRSPTWGPMAVSSVSFRITHSISSRKDRSSVFQFSLLPSRRFLKQKMGKCYYYCEQYLFGEQLLKQDGKCYY